MSGPRAVFIGPMGSGKTKVGKRVAKALGVSFLDTDKMIVAEHGPIAEIFDTHGEPHFRALEREAVRNALTSSGIVSLGGGAVLDPDTQTQLAELPVVYLTITADAVAARLGDGKRPLVRGGVADWQRIFDARRDIYERLATIEIDTSATPYDGIAHEVTTWLEQQ